MQMRPYLWSSLTSNSKEMERRFGPILVSEKFNIHERGFSAAGSFLPYSPDGYYIELRGFVSTVGGKFQADEEFPTINSRTRSLLEKSKARFHIAVSQCGNVIVNKDVCMIDAMQERMKMRRVPLNSYPVCFIDTAPCDPSEIVTVQVIVLVPDMDFSTFNGYVSLYVRGYVDL